MNVGSGSEGVPRSQWNDGNGADFGPSRGDPFRTAFRPKRKFPLHSTIGTFQR
jgi:hypothetical protein